MPGPSPHSTSPSDSGVLQGSVVPPHVNGSPEQPDSPPRQRQQVSAAAPADPEDHAEALRDVPMPEGFLKRLRRFVDEL